jgi:hypothetical protein
VKKVPCGKIANVTTTEPPTMATITNRLVNIPNACATATVNCNRNVWFCACVSVINRRNAMASVTIRPVATVGGTGVGASDVRVVQAARVPGHAAEHGIHIPELPTSNAPVASGHVKHAVAPARNAYCHGAHATQAVAPSNAMKVPRMVVLVAASIDAVESSIGQGPVLSGPHSRHVNARLLSGTTLRGTGSIQLAEHAAQVVLPD